MALELTPSPGSVGQSDCVRRNPSGELRDRLCWRSNLTGAVHALRVPGTRHNLPCRAKADDWHNPQSSNYSSIPNVGANYYVGLISNGGQNVGNYGVSPVDSRCIPENKRSLSRAYVAPKVVASRGRVVKFDVLFPSGWGILNHNQGNRVVCGPELFTLHVPSCLAARPKATVECIRLRRISSTRSGLNSKVKAIQFEASASIPASGSIMWLSAERNDQPPTELHLGAPSTR